MRNHFARVFQYPSQPINAFSLHVIIQTGYSKIIFSCTTSNCKFIISSSLELNSGTVWCLMQLSLTNLKSTLVAGVATIVFPEEYHKKQWLGENHVDCSVSNRRTKSDHLLNMLQTLSTQTKKWNHVRHASSTFFVSSCRDAGVDSYTN